jgi:hypothetical protein
MKVWFQEPDGTAKSTLKRSQEMVNSIVFFPFMISVDILSVEIWWI